MNNHYNTQHKKQNSFSKNTQIFYLYLFFLIGFILIFFTVYHIQTKKKIANFLNENNLSQNEIQYKNASTSFFGDSVIFYHVTFPELNIQHSINKIIIKKEGHKINVKLLDVDINVINSLRKSYNIHILDVLKAYNPVQDVFQKPLQTLAVSNVDNVKLNVNISIEMKSEKTFLSGYLHLAHLAEIKFRSTIERNPTFPSTLLHALCGRLSTQYLSIYDLGIFSKYDSYLNSLNYKQSHSYRQLLNTSFLEFDNKNLTDLNTESAYKKDKLDLPF